MAKRRGDEASGGQTTVGHYGARIQRGPESEQLACLVVKATADGYVVGRALVDLGAVEWISPSHTRPWLETRPTDVRVPALVQGNIGGRTELRAARTAKGVPVPTTVGYEVVFGEMLDSASQRAKGELKRMIEGVVKRRRTYWRHLCAAALMQDLPTRIATLNGERCAHCGKGEAKPATVVAA